MTHDLCPMHLPPLPSITNSHVIVIGDVSIDKSAAIAPGVILQADPDSRIIIAAGVCIGMGAILHAHKGIIEIDPGAILGAGVLVVGVGKIGANACIGAATTIWNSSVDSWQILPAGSVIGDKGRKIADASVSPPTETVRVTPEVPAATLTEEVAAATSEPARSETAKADNETNGQSAQLEAQTETAPTESPPTPETELPQKEQPESKSNSGSVTVYGQAHLNQLLTTLFPYKSASKPPPKEE